MNQIEELIVIRNYATTAPWGGIIHPQRAWSCRSCGAEANTPETIAHRPECAVTELRALQADAERYCRIRHSHVKQCQSNTTP